ncbi:MAG TPA: histidine phosphatase family protein [Bacteroidales bacterium]|nr:histidine phosphatase family protein [Bacteroidales bacterium]
MKSVILVRHGKASHDDTLFEDIKRPLTAEGRKRTKRIARYLADKNIGIEKLITSPAARAFETAKIFACELGVDPGDFIVEDSVYEALPENIQDVLFSLPDDVNRVMIVGHNPGMYLFANQFLKPAIESLPTTGTIAIQFHTDEWFNTADCKTGVDFIVFPSMLK